MLYFIHLRSEVFTQIRNGIAYPMNFAVAQSINGKRFKSIADMEALMELPLYKHRVPEYGSPYNIISPVNMCDIINNSGNGLSGLKEHAFAAVEIEEEA